MVGFLLYRHQQQHIRNRHCPEFINDINKGDKSEIHKENDQRNQNGDHAKGASGF